MPSSFVPPLAEFDAARRRISGRVRRTPFVHCPWLSDVSGGAVHLKLESLQLTSSFKLRGAFNACLALVERVAPGAGLPVVVTASAGNHGRGMAWACHQLGLRLVVFTPAQAPRAKLDAIGRLGADLRPIATTYEETEVLAKAFAADTGATFVSPYSHPDVIAGAGTVALEMLDNHPSLDMVVVPVGGGGLISGIGAVVKQVAPTAEVVGVEVEASHAFTASLAAGRIVEVEVAPSLADGLTGNMDPETITFDIVQSVVNRIVLVSESDLVSAVRGLFGAEHLIAEGAGVAGVAAVLSRRIEVGGRRVGVVVSGANIDASRLVPLLAQP